MVSIKEANVSLAKIDTSVSKRQVSIKSFKRRLLLVPKVDSTVTFLRKLLLQAGLTAGSTPTIGS